jgi:Family of unknown function (DUF6496)
MGAVSRREHAHRGLVEGRRGFPIQRKEDVRTHGMPQTKTIERARREKREGKSASTQAGEFVREEIETIRKGEHGARSAKQAIAIGLSKARRAGVKLPAPAKGKTSEETREKAKRDLEKAKSGSAKKPSRKRSRATLKALKREGRAAASKEALSKQARAAGRKRTPAERSAAAKKAARTRARRK